MLLLCKVKCTTKLVKSAEVLLEINTLTKMFMNVLYTLVILPFHLYLNFPFYLITSFDFLYKIQNFLIHIDSSLFLLISQLKFSLSFIGILSFMCILTPKHQQFFRGLKSSMGITILNQFQKKKLKIFFSEIYRTCHAKSLVYTINW